MGVMKIDAIRLYGFDLSLSRPVVMRGQSILTREGFIIQAVSSDGFSGFGEVSPLPGVHVELLKKARFDHDNCCSSLQGVEVPDDAQALLAWCEKFEPFVKSCPSARFGLETAILSLAASRKRMSLAAFLGYEGVADVACAGFLQGSVRDVAQAGMAFKADGFRTVGLTVGGKNVPLEVEKVIELKRALGRDIKIRLNANAGWTLSDALLFARGIGNDQIEFLEEPLVDTREWHSFFRQADIPLAAGAHLCNFEEIDLAQAAGVKYALITPSSFGGVGKFIRFLTSSREGGGKVVIGSCLESGIGLNVLANLAALTGTSAGIATAFLFNDDLLRAPLVTGGVVPFSRLALTADDLVPEFRRRLILS
jgi:o-succinylbenzoate synthase